MAKKGTSKRKMKKAEKAQLNQQIHRLENKALGQAMADKRSSNAAQPHVPSYRKGTRSVKNRIAIREW